MDTLDIPLPGGSQIAGTPEQLRADGVDEALIGTALAQLRARDVAAEARRRVYALTNTEQQVRVVTAGVAVLAKAMATGEPDHTGTLEAIGQATQWTLAIEARAAEIVADPGIDFRSDEAWPPVPPLVALAYAR